MTTQIPDEVRYRGRWYAITAVDGKGLFDPVESGLDPGPLSTGCYRGCCCRYTVHAGRLTLHQMEMGRPENRPAMVRLAGVKPHVVARSQVHAGAWDYRRLGLAQPFTGRLLVGTGYLDVGRIGMGFLPAWAYRRVLELTFTGGRLRIAANRSSELAMVRERLGDAGHGPAPGESNRDWIARTFSLSFAYSWPRLPATTTTAR